jgi:hypothetical protein
VDRDATHLFSRTRIELKSAAAGALKSERLGISWNHCIRFVGRVERDEAFERSKPSRKAMMKSMVAKL